MGSRQSAPDSYRDGSQQSFESVAFFLCFDYFFTTKDTKECAKYRKSYSDHSGELAVEKIFSISAREDTSHGGQNFTEVFSWLLNKPVDDIFKIFLLTAFYSRLAIFNCVSSQVFQRQFSFLKFFSLRAIKTCISLLSQLFKI